MVSTVILLLGPFLLGYLLGSIPFGLVLTRDVHTLAKRHEEVVIAHQFDVEAFLLFQAFGEQLRDGKHHILFPFALGTDSTVKRAGVEMGKAKARRQRPGR